MLGRKTGPTSHSRAVERTLLPSIRHRKNHWPAIPVPVLGWTNVFDPETAFVASATGEGTIHIIHEDSPDKFSVVETVHTEFGAKTMALDPKTHNLFVDTSDFDSPGAAMSKQPNPQRRLSRECSGC